MERYHIFGLGGPSKASGIQLDICGDSLVFIFPLAPMLTFTSAVGKLNVRVLWHHTCCCKSYHTYTVKFSSNPTISFSRKSTRNDPPVKSDQNKAISVHVLWVSFHHRSTPVLSSSHHFFLLSPLHQCYCC